MIYCLGKEILTKIVHQENIDVIEKLMSDLKDIVASDYHYVTTDYAGFLNLVKEALAKIDDHQKSTQWILTYIRKEFITDFSLVRKIHPKVIVDVGEQFSFKKTNGDVYLVYDSHEPKVKFKESVYLISENTSDNILYEELAKCFFEKQLNLKDGKFALEVKYQNGGGGTIGSVIEASLEHDQQASLVIVDSDQHYPTCDNGATAEKANKTVNEICHSSSCDLSGAVQLLVLEVSEKENLLLPSDYISSKNWNTGNGFRKGEVQNLNQLVNIENETDSDGKYYLDYYDFKNGVDTEKNQYFKHLLNKHNIYNIGLGRNVLKHIDCKKIDWDNEKNRLFKIRESIGFSIIAFGFSKAKETMV